MFPNTKKNQEKLFKPFLQTGRLDCWGFFLVLKTFFFVPKYDKILSDRLCWCLALLTEIRIVKKSWRAGLVVCNPAQFLRGIFSGQMNTTLPKIEGRPLCSVVLSACYHTAPLWWAETDNHLCRSESSRKWRRTKLCWKRPGCFLLLCLLKWVRERDVKWKLPPMWLLKHVKDFVSVWWWCRSAGIHAQLQITSFSVAETCYSFLFFLWSALKWDTHTHVFKWPWLCLRSDNRVMAEQAEPSGFCAYVGIKNQIVTKGNWKRSRRQIWNRFVRIAVMIEARPAGLSQMKEVSMVVRGTDDNSNYWWDISGIPLSRLVELWNRRTAGHIHQTALS